MRVALRVAAGVDDSQSVELRDRAGMVATVLTLQQFWIALLGRATTSAAAEITSCDRAHRKSEGGEAAIQMVRWISSSMCISDSIRTSRHVRFALHLQSGSLPR